MRLTQSLMSVPDPPPPSEDMVIPICEEQLGMSKTILKREHPCETAQFKPTATVLPSIFVVLIRIFLIAV